MHPLSRPPSLRAYACVTSHMWMRHCHACEWTVSHVWMRHRHTYGWVTWHISMRHCDASEWVSCECIIVTHVSESRKSLVGVNEYECAKCWVMQQSSPALYPSSTSTSIIYTYIHHLHLHPSFTPMSVQDVEWCDSLVLLYVTVQSCSTSIIYTYIHHLHLHPSSTSTSLIYTYIHISQTQSVFQTPPTQQII